MKLDKDRLIAKDPAALKELERVIRECVRIGASQVGALDFIDDLSQELMMLVLFKTIHVYDPDREIEPFLIKAAKLAGMAMRRRHGREVLMGGGGGGGEEEDGFASWMGNIADPNHEDAGDRVDREFAEEQSEAEAFLAAATLEIAQSISAEQGIDHDEAEQVAAPPEASAAPSRTGTPAKSKAKKRPASPRSDDSGPADSEWDALLAEVPAPPRRPSAPRALSPQALRLREIRLLIRYTHKWMAEALGIQISQLHAIEYGVTEPADVLLAKAEALHERLRTEAPVLLSGTTTDVVKSWLGRLGLAEDDYAGFAAEIGVDRSTAFRWLRATYKPTSDRLWTIELMVQVAERRRSELVSALPKPAA